MIVNLDKSWKTLWNYIQMPSLQNIRNPKGINITQKRQLDTNTTSMGVEGGRSELGGVVGGASGVGEVV